MLGERPRTVHFCAVRQPPCGVVFAMAAPRHGRGAVSGGLSPDSSSLCWAGVAEKSTAAKELATMWKTPRNLAFLDDRFHEFGMRGEFVMRGTGSVLVDSLFEIGRTRIGIMATWRRAVELAMSQEEIERLTAVSRSRTERASRVSRAAMLLAYREAPSFFAVGRRLGVHHQTVQRCVERAVAYGAVAALDDRPRPGKEPVITPEAKAWLVSLACDKAKEHGYPHELWTTRLLAHPCFAKLVQGTVCKILGQEEIKPRCATTWNVATPSSSRRWLRSCVCIARSGS